MRSTLGRMLIAVAVLVFHVAQMVGGEGDTTIRVTIGDDEAVFRMVSPKLEKTNYPVFYMQETEVTNKQYKQFLKSTNRTKDDSEIVKIVKEREKSNQFSTGDISYSVKDPDAIWRNSEFPKGEESFPVCFATLDEATDFCKWLTENNPKFGTFRLPTWNEWMIAAYGSKRNFPWGNQWNKSLLHASYGYGYGNDAQPKRTESVTARPKGRTPQGIYGMLGNASELINEGDQASKNYFNLGARWMGGGFTEGYSFDWDTANNVKPMKGVPRQDYWGYSHHSTLRQCDLGFRVLLDPSRDETLLNRPRVFNQNNRNWMVEDK